VSDHPFDKLFKRRGRSPDSRIVEIAERAFEETRLRFLLRVFKFNVKAESARIRREAEDGLLTFANFRRTHSDFPLVLGVSRLHGVKLHLDPAAMLPALMKQFSDSPIWEAYEKFYAAAENSSDGRPVVLAFPRKGITHGLCVYATDDVAQPPLCRQEALLCYATGGKRQRMFAVVRTFQNLLEGVYAAGHGWRPS
jgi:hypothetical protein